MAGPASHAFLTSRHLFGQERGQHGPCVRDNLREGIHFSGAIDPYQLANALDPRDESHRS